MTSSGSLRPLLATARIANVPSVVSNVWVGIAIGAAFQHWEHPGSFWLDALLLVLAGILLYIGGNFLNDWHDREWDARNRPERALPSGLYRPGTYLTAALGLGLAGIIAAALVDLRCAVVAALIALFIVVYTRWHKVAVWPVIPMGLCRALLPVMGFVGFSNLVRHDTYYLLAGPIGIPAVETIVLFHSLSLMLYIAGLTLGARYESAARPSPVALGISKSVLIVSGLLAALLWAGLNPVPAAIAIVPFALWLCLCLTRYRKPIPVHVSALLAGIPLLDWIALLAYSLLRPPLSYPPAIQPYLIACILIPPLAFIAGRTLQKVASAT